MVMRMAAGLVAPHRFPPSPQPDVTKLMSAVVMKKHGGVEVLQYQDFPSPLPTTPHHVLVEIAATGVNPVDVKMRKGPIADFMYPKPKIIGSDIAGIVIQASANSMFHVGQRVFGMLPLLGTVFGGYAARCCVDERILAPAPDNVRLRDLAVLPLVTCTLIQALRPVLQSYQV